MPETQETQEMQEMQEIQKQCYKMEFIASHKPILKPGTYSFTMKQTVDGRQVKSSNSAETEKFPTEHFSQSRQVKIDAPGTKLLPQDVQAVYPPAGSQSHHGEVLPHINLTHSTLPWQYTAVQNDSNLNDNSLKNTPWLALILVNEDEPVTQVAASTIELNESWLQDNNILPNAKELQYLTHVRQPILFVLESTSEISNFLQKKEIDKRQAQRQKVIDLFKAQGVILSPQLVVLNKKTDHWAIVDKENNQEYHLQKDGSVFKVYRPQNARALVVANRFPTVDKRNTAYLVSIRELYNEQGFDFDKAKGDSENTIRLTYLKKWQFTCLQKPKESLGQQQSISPNSFAKHLQDLKKERENENENEKGIDTLQLPDSGKSEVVQAHIKTGQVPLLHHLRRGGRTVSWYRGPLLPGGLEANQTAVKLPAQTADELLVYNPQNGMFDISYAAAWEMGRLLMLHNKDISKQLYQWKRSHAKQVWQTRESINHLPLLKNASQNTAALEMPKDVQNFFESLSLLKGVPFSYLVPQEAMLPADSLRFFQVDPVWVACLLDGAFSIGRVTQGDHASDREHIKKMAAGDVPVCLSGCLLRSEVVAGWPDMLVDAYDTTPQAEKIPLRRMERLSPNVLFCLFEGEKSLQSINIHEKSENLHFGLTKKNGAWYKQLRNSLGEEPKIDAIALTDTIWKKVKDERISILDMEQLFQEIKGGVMKQKAHLGFNMFTPAQFALQMMQGVQQVRFCLDLDLD